MEKRVDRGVESRAQKPARVPHLLRPPVSSAASLRVGSFCLRSGSFSLLSFSFFLLLLMRCGDRLALIHHFSGRAQRGGARLFVVPACALHEEREKKKRRRRRRTRRHYESSGSARASVGRTQQQTNKQTKAARGAPSRDRASLQVTFGVFLCSLNSPPIPLFHNLLFVQ